MMSPFCVAVNWPLIVKYSLPMASKYNTGSWRIYAITNKLDGMTYVGQTVCKLERRWHEHKKAAFIDDSQCYIHRAMRLHGIDNFEMKLIIDDIKTFEEANVAEKKYVAELKTLLPDGYNMTEGGDGVVGLARTPESRERMRQSALRRHAENPETPEQLEKRSAAMRGIKRGPETLANMRAGFLRGADHPHFGKPAVNKGIPATPEQIEANRAHQRQVQNRPEVKAWNSFAQKAVFARKRIAKGKALEGDSRLVQDFEEKKAARRV